MTQRLASYLRPVIKFGACFIIIFQLGCSSATKRDRALTTILGSGLVGGAIGSITAPEGTSPAMHGLFWAGISSAIAGVVSHFVFNNQEDVKALEAQNQILKKEIAALKDPITSTEPELLFKNHAPFGKEIPREYERFISPGQWSLYKLDQWITRGEGVLIHQDRMLKLIPPQLNPGTVINESD